MKTKNVIACVGFIAIFWLVVIAMLLAQPLRITVDYPASTLDETGMYVCLRVGPLQRTRMAYYATPLDFEGDLIAWKMRDDVEVKEVTE